ncbi:MAG: translocation/assembly module TamB domain-containing protein [Longimicrobiales bacterium]
MIGALALLATLLSAWLLQTAPPSGLPRLPLPDPVPARALQKAPRTINIRVQDARFRVAMTQTRIELPLIEVRSVLPDLNRPISELHIESLRIVRLRAIAPIDTIITPMDAFTRIPGPRLRIDRVSLVDADIGELADPRLGYGRWFYHAADLDLELRDVDVAGQRTAPERLRIDRLDLAGEVRGDPFAITRFAADIARIPTRFDLQLAASFGLTTLGLQTSFSPADDFTLHVKADTIRFAELRAFEASLPRLGTGKIDISAARNGDAGYVLFRRATAQFGASHVSVLGRLESGAPCDANELAVLLTNVRPDDIKEAFAVKLPGEGPYNGRILATGDLQTGVRVNGAVTGGPVNELSQLVVNGRVRTEPEPALDVQLTGDPFRMMDTTFTFRVRASGPIDSLALRGIVQLGPETATRARVIASTQAAPLSFAGNPAAHVDLLLLDPPGAASRQLRGRTTIQSSAYAHGESTATLAVAEGSVILSKKPTVNARISADSLPLAALPWPVTVDSVRGFARGRIQVSGQLSEPDVNGELRLHQGGFRARPARLTVSQIQGSILLRDERVSTDSITARVQEGVVHVRGSAGRSRSSALSVDVAMDSLPLAGLPVPAEHVDRLAGHARGRVAVRGTIEHPTVDGSARLVDAAGHLRATGMEITRVNGVLRLYGDSMRTDGIIGMAGPGTIALSGSGRWREDPAFDVRLRADRAQLVNTDSANILASANLSVTGNLEQPRIAGRIRLVGGWAKEDLLRSNPVIDPDAPPYAGLAARVPWMANSRLRAARAQKSGPHLRGQFTVEVTPAIKLIDEDSELISRGELVITADSSGLEPSGGVNLLRGYYANFGERFLVTGGVQQFTNGEARISMHADHDVNKLDGRDLGSISPLGWYPALEIFVLGTMSAAKDELRRNSPLPESQSQLGAALIFREPIEPITGWSNSLFWLADHASDFWGKRTEQQGSILLWDYAADEAYDYVPLSRIGFHGGTVTVGSRFPGRIVQGPLFRVGLNATRHVNLQAILAPEGDALPGLRARWRNGRWSASVFNEPKFYAAPPGGDPWPGYFYRRRTGIGLRWDRDF